MINRQMTALALQVAEHLRAHLAEIAALRAQLAAAEAERGRMRERVRGILSAAGCECGCASGDPLDWTDTQVHAALFAITEKQEAISERFDLFLAMAEDVAEGHRPAKDLTEAIAQERAFLGVSGA